MANAEGFRSIKIFVSNMVEADFSIAAPEALSGRWISGMEAKQGEVLKEYSAGHWGLKTDDPNSALSGQFALIGYGDPMTVTFFLNEQGLSGASCPGNSEVVVIIHPVETGEHSHPAFAFTLSEA